MVNKIKRTIKKYDMICKNDRIVIGVSGGSDSMCLLHFLRSISQEYNLKLFVVHINHCIRGEDADLDQQYVEDICEEWNIPCYAYKVDIKNKAKIEAICEEEMGRRVRYGTFLEVMKQNNANKIAVAHNKNDVVETIFFNFTRGTGLNGIVGIKPKIDNIIRPIIDCEKKEIDKYCKDNNIEVRIDHTNFETVYTRNKIRNEIIPYIKENINKNVVNNIYRAGKIFEDEEDYLNNIVQLKYKDALEEEVVNKIVFNINDLKNNHIAINRRIIKLAIANISRNGMKDISYVNVSDVIKLLNNTSGKEIVLKDNIIVKKLYNNLVIEKDIVCDREIYYEVENVPYKIELDKCIVEFSYDKKFHLNINSLVENFNIKEEELEKLRIRTRREGDYIYLKKDSMKQKLKKYFINNKINKDEREKILLLAKGREIVWIIGYRVNPKYKIYNDNDEKVLSVKVDFLN